MKKGRPLILILSAVASMALLMVFLVVQSHYGHPLDLRTIWVVISLLPVAIVLVARYIIVTYKDVEIGPRLEPTAQAERLPTVPVAPGSGPPAVANVNPANSVLLQAYSQIYERDDHYFLAHEYRPSTVEGQKYEAFIFIARHHKGREGPPQREGFSDIAKAEFFFGDSWGNQVFEVKKTDGAIGWRTNAWGTFLAICRITFVDSHHRDPAILYRFVDFFMAPERDQERHVSSAEEEKHRRLQKERDEESKRKLRKQTVL